MTPTRPQGSAALGLILAGAIACGNPVTPVQCFCTEEFRIFTLSVTDISGGPVSDVVLTRTLVRTSDTLEPGWLGLLVPGSYLIADDGMLDVFVRTKETKHSLLRCLILVLFLKTPTA